MSIIYSWYAYFFESPQINLMYHVSRGNLDNVNYWATNSQLDLSTTTDRRGYTCLCLAAIHGHDHVIRYLLDQGAAIDQVAGGTSNVHYSVASFLPVYHQHVGCTPLMLASMYANGNVVEMLLGHGAQVNAVHAHNGNSALLYAAGSEEKVGVDDTISALLRHGADIRHKNNQGNNALLHATWCNRTPGIRTLLENIQHTPGLQDYIHEKGMFGDTALITACQNNNLEAVDLLLDAGSRIDDADQAGWTGLFRAAACGHTEMVMLLLRRGADMFRKDCQGNTALAIAKRENHERVVELLSGES